MTTYKTLRQFVIDGNYSLPPIADKVQLSGSSEPILHPEQAAAERSAYEAIRVNYNAAGFRTLKTLLLGRKGLYDMFGLRAAAISRSLQEVIDNAWPQQAEQILSAGLPNGIALADLRAALNELGQLMLPESQEAPDFGNPLAGNLLDALYVLGVLLPEERQAFEAARTITVTIDSTQAWNELHTWVEGRPTA